MFNDLLYSVEILAWLAENTAPVDTKGNKENEDDDKSD